MHKFWVLVLLISCDVQVVFSQWHIVNSTQNLFAVDFVNDSTGLVVHDMIDGSYILKTVDYGASWDTVASYTPSFFFEDVVFASDSVAYACGGPHLFLKSIDAGETWFDPSVGQDPYFTDLFFINDTLGYGAHGDGGTRLGVTTDGGVSWQLNEDYGGRDLQFYNDCEGGAVIGTGFFNTNNCAETWNYDTIETINRTWNTLWILNADTLFIGALGGFGTYFGFNYGSIGRSYDGGQTFSILDFPYAKSIDDLFFVDSQIGYAGCGSHYDGYQYSILKTIDGGTSWGYQEIDLNPLFNDFTGISEIDCPSPGNCYAVGAGIYRTTNGGGAIHEAWVEVGTTEMSQNPKTIDIYPNPSSEFINISLMNTNHELSLLQIIDAQGRIVVSQKIPFGSRQFHLNIEMLNSGIYMLVVSGHGQSIVEKFVKE